LYSLQLLVVDQDQTVRTAITQVTIDNQPPEISIKYPKGGQVIDPSELNHLPYRLTTDNLALDRLELARWPNHRNINFAPFILMWRGVPGSHGLQVKALTRQVTRLRRLPIFL
jgi:hypothetical protein